MIKQYPYQLWVLAVAESDVDNQGNFLESESQFVLTASCRDEANTGGQTVQLADSSTIKYDTLIQLPKSCPVIEAGASIKVLDGSTLRVEGIVKRFSRDQLHCRLWV
ncbi:hypothetical protein GCM10028806_28510 [Spirosoma terrae]|uniref:Head-tail adaptor protein n=1 Tax=Spirosoma terrae TaxID=1968276 RepID=A0A6L9LKK6_9BACT|nr:hypothetical protein [Spirosoma terrae]NDU97189.1 hypothetical protein [Spirosoma terrae]